MPSTAIARRPRAIRRNMWAVVTGLSLLVAIAPPVSATAAPTFDLHVSKTSDPTTVAPGGTVVFTVTVHNGGPDAAPNVTMTDTLPAETTATATTPSAGTCSSPTGATVICEPGSIAAGDSVTFDITATVPSTAGTIENTVAANSTETDQQPNDNSGSAQVLVAEPSADLSIVKSPPHMPVAPGAQMTFFMTVNNAGPFAATGVTVTDPLPAGTTFDDAASSDGCDVAEGVVTCAVGDLAAGAGASVFVALGAPAEPGTVTNTASVTASGPQDPHGTNNSSTAEGQVVDEANLMLMKSDSIDPVGVGDPYGYALHLTNSGPSDARNVQITDVLPAGLGFVSVESIDASCGQTEGTVTCTAATLAVGDEIHVDLNVTAPAVAGVVTNTASVSAENAANPQDNEDSEETQVLESGANLSLTKTADRQTAEVDGPLTYTLTVTNAGPDPAENVEVHDTIAAGLTLLNVTTDVVGGDCTGNPEIVCTLGTLDAGAIATVTIEVHAPSQPGPLENSATVTSTTVDANTQDNTGSVTVAVSNQADLSVTKSADLSAVDQGGQVRYAITASNNGPVTARDVTIADPLPEALTYVSDDQDACTYDAGTGQVTCAVGSLAAFASFSFEVTVTAPAADQVVYNTAIVSASSPDPDPENNQDTHSLIVGDPALADLGVNAYWQTDPIAAGSPTELQISVTNGGPDMAVGVHATLTVPDGLDLGSPPPPADARAEGTAPPCLRDGNEITCEIGDIASGATFMHSITGTAAADGTYTVRLHAGTGTTGDPNLDNNDAEATLHVLAEGSADLGLYAYSPGAGAVGDPQPYSFYVSNNGPAEATGVEVTHTLPAGATFSLANIDGGSCALAGSVVTCSIATLPQHGGASGLIEIVPGAEGAMTAVFAVNGDGPDPEPANDVVELTDDILAEGAADLGVSVFGPNEVAAGSPSDFYVYASNDGPSEATGVNVNISLPNGWMGTASWSGGTCTGTGELTCAVGSLGVGYYEYIDLQVTPGSSPAGPTRNVAVPAGDMIVATIDGDGGDPNAENDESQFEVTTLAEGSANLSITKGGPTTAAAGEPFSFFMGGVNHGPADAANTIVSDTLPDGLTFVSANTSQGTCTHLDGQVTCDLGNVQRHSGYWIEVTVTAGGAGTVENTATIASDGADPSAADNSSTHQVEVLPEGSADVSISKFGDGNGAVDSPYNYTIVVSNNGPGSVDDVVVTDPLPDGMTFQSATSSQGTCTADGGTVTCQIGSLSAFGSVHIQIIVVPTQAGLVSNTATVTSGGTDPNDVNNTATFESEVFAAGATDLQITKTASSYASAEQPMSFQIWVYNEGPAPAGHAVVTDVLPEGWTFNSAYASQGVCSFDAGTRTVTCRLGTLGLYQSAYIDISATPSAAGTYTNTASVSHDEENLDDDDNQDTVEFEVSSASAIDVAIVKSGQNLAVAGSNYRYNLAVTNYGYTPAHDVVVTDPLPAGMTFVSATPDQGTCTFDSGALTCDLGEVASFETVNIVLIVVPNEVDENIANTARVDTSSEDYYPDDDADSHEIDVVPPGTTDLAIDKYGWTTNAEQNASYAYYISVQNLGPSAAPDVVVSDTIPASMTISGAYPSTGTCTIVDQTVTCDLGILAAYETGWIAIYVTPTATGAIRNTATVTSGATDENDANDSDTFEIDVFAEGTADLSITKVDEVDPGVLDRVFRYGLVVENNGPGDAPEAVVQDQLPDGVTFIAASPSQGSCTHAAGVITCDLGTVYNWYTVYIDVLVRPTALGALTNTASVSHGTGGLDPTTSNNTDSETTTIVEEVTGDATGTGGQQSRDEDTGELTVSMGRGAREDITITVPAECPDGSTPTSVTLSIGTFQVTMTPAGSGMYTGTIPADEVASGNLVVTVVCGEDPIPNPVGQIVLYDPSGNVTNAANGAAIVGATVVLHSVPGWRARTGPADLSPDTCESNDSKDPGDDWSQVAPTAEGVIEPALSGRLDPALNPQLTDDVGHYGWDVAAGCWYVTVAKPGFKTLTSPVVGVPPAVTDLDLELQPLSLSITPPTTAPVFGKSFTISGVTSPGVAGCKSRAVKLQRDALGGAVSFQTVATVTSNALGRFSKALVATGALGTTGTWRAVADATALCGAVTSAAKVIKVAKAVTLKASATSVRSGRTVSLTSKVLPCGAHARKNVTLQKKVGSRWVNVKTLRTGSTCVAVFSVIITATTVFRVISPVSDTDHAIGTSLPVTVRKM